MSEKILVPILGESITEATVVKWLKNTGDTVEADEPIVELETEKVNLEVPSPLNGVLSEITAKDGQVVEVGAILGLITNGKSKIKTKNITKQKQKKEKNLETNEDAPELFDNNVLKLEESKERLFINILDPAYISVEKYHPNQVIIILLSIILGIFVSILSLITYSNIYNAIINE